MLMSEFIGTSASVGTAQEAYRFGISASWNIIALGAGILAYGWLLAGKYKASGHNTISAIFADVYGPQTSIATSLVMIFALQIVAVAMYAGGGAILSGLLAVDRTAATVICGIVAVFYVFMGGMKSVVYTNVIHSFVKYIGICVALYFGFTKVGRFQGLRARLPDEMFSWTHVGFGQIFAWFIAGIGATFSTQFVIQAINTVESREKANAASVYAALLLVPFGIATTLIGMCSLVLFPDIKSINAFSALISQMNSVMAGVVAAGLAVSLFGTIAAISVATATLLYKDFYARFVTSADEEKRSLNFIRLATIAMGLLPIALAIYTPNVLQVTFLAKAIRASLSVLVLLVFLRSLVRQQNRRTRQHPVFHGGHHRMVLDGQSVRDRQRLCRAGASADHHGPELSVAANRPQPHRPGSKGGEPNRFRRTSRRSGAPIPTLMAKMRLGGPLRNLQKTISFFWGSRGFLISRLSGRWHSPAHGVGRSEYPR